MSFLLLPAVFLLACRGTEAGNAGLYGQIRYPLQNGKTLVLSGVPASSEEGVVSALNGLSEEEIFSSRIYLQNPGFIDAEKAGSSGRDGDASLCWAACAADMLEVTGWREEGADPETGEPFASEDDLFRCYADHFTNGPGDIESALIWFFTGEYPLADPAEDEAVPKAGARTKAAVSEGFREGLITAERIAGQPERLTDLLTGIEQGDAVSIAVEYRQAVSRTETERHSITVFGYIRDNRTGLPEILAAADSEDSCTGEREKADNRYRFLSIRRRTIGGQTEWALEHYGESSSDAVITTVYVLKHKS